MIYRHPHRCTSEAVRAQVTSAWLSSQGRLPFGLRGAKDSPARWARAGLCGVGGAEDVVVVAEDGGDLEVSAEGLDVAGDGFDGGDFAAFDLGDAALGDAH